MKGLNCRLISSQALEEVRKIQPKRTLFTGMFYVFSIYLFTSKNYSIFTSRTTRRRALNSCLTLLYSNRILCLLLIIIIIIFVLLVLYLWRYDASNGSWEGEQLSYEIDGDRRSWCTTELWRASYTSDSLGFWHFFYRSKRWKIYIFKVQ